MRYLKYQEGREVTPRNSYPAAHFLSPFFSMSLFGFSGEGGMAAPFPCSVLPFLHRATLRLLPLSFTHSSLRSRAGSWCLPSSPHQGSAVRHVQSWHLILLPLPSLCGLGAVGGTGSFSPRELTAVCHRVLGPWHHGCPEPLSPSSL